MAQILAKWPLRQCLNVGQRAKWSDKLTEIVCTLLQNEKKPYRQKKMKKKTAVIFLTSSFDPFSQPRRLSRQTEMSYKVGLWILLGFWASFLALLRFYIPRIHYTVWKNHIISTSLTFYVKSKSQNLPFTDSEFGFFRHFLKVEITHINKLQSPKHGNFETSTFILIDFT